jgi:hypothetical protein
MPEAVTDLKKYILNGFFFMNEGKESTIPLLDEYPKPYKSTYNRNTCTTMFTTALFTISQTLSRLITNIW